jgi:hypothetical protein
MSETDKAKQELKLAWDRLCSAESAEVKNLKIEFGKICQLWHDWYAEKSKNKGDRIRFLWKSLGIPHTAAYEAMASYRISDPDYAIPIIELTKEEIERSEIKAINENRLEQFFEGCGFPFQIRQNCATREYHYNLVFTALTEEKIKEIAAIFWLGKDVAVHSEDK